MTIFLFGHGSNWYLGWKEQSQNESYQNELIFAIAKLIKSNVRKKKTILIK